MTAKRMRVITTCPYCGEKVYELTRNAEFAISKMGTQRVKQYIHATCWKEQLKAQRRMKECNNEEV